MARPALKSIPGNRATALLRSRLANGAPQRALFSEARWRQLVESLALTPRQGEIARLMCDGHTYKAIALRIGISVNTVRMHIRALFAKLAAHDRLSAVLQLITADRALSTRRRL